VLLATLVCVLLMFPLFAAIRMAVEWRGKRRRRAYTLFSLFFLFFFFFQERGVEEMMDLDRVALPDIAMRWLLEDFLGGTFFSPCLFFASVNLAIIGVVFGLDADYS